MSFLFAVLAQVNVSYELNVGDVSRGSRLPGQLLLVVRSSGLTECSSDLFARPRHVPKLETARVSTAEFRKVRHVKTMDFCVDITEEGRLHSGRGHVAEPVYGLKKAHGRAERILGAPLYENRAYTLTSEHRRLCMRVWDVSERTPERGSVLCVTLLPTWKHNKRAVRFTIQHSLSQKQ